MSTPPDFIRNRSWAPLALVAGIYLVLGAIFVGIVPALEKPDEEWHYAYVVYLLDTGSLPPISTDETINPARQEAGQPPLYYLVAASTARLFGLQATPLHLSPNPYWAYPAPGTVNDNKNRYVHQPDELASSELRTLVSLRALSLLLGAGTVICVYGLVRALGLSRPLALASSLAIALMPQYLFIATSVSNDGLVTALSSAALWALVAAVQRGHSGRHWALFGALAGLASLTKLSALLLPVLGVALAMWLGLRRRSWRVALVGSAASLGGVLLLDGWWYLRNTLAYGDPLGIGIHFTKVGRAEALSLSGLAGQWEAIEISFWAAFGWGNVHLPAWIYSGLRLFVVAAAIGLVIYLANHFRQRTVSVSLWVVLAYAAFVGVGLAWWTQSVTASLGRLLFPGLAALVSLVMLGLHRLWRWLPVVCVGWLGVAAILSPVFIAQAYQPPTMNGEVESAAAQPLNVRLGDLVELSSFEISSPRIEAGNPIEVTLCWQVLSATDQNYSVFVHILGAADSIIGERTSYPGLGSFATSLWQVGDRFCDHYSVPVSAPIEGSGVYDVEVGMFDLATGQRLPAADAGGNLVELLIIARVKIIGAALTVPPSATPLRANFADVIALVGYEAGEARPGKNLPLTVYWQARSDVTQDYTVFVHVMNAKGELAAQADSPPQAGRFPTHWWEAGEIVADARQIPLPPGLEAGDYTIRVGLYLPETGERLLLTDQEADAVVVMTVRIAD